MIEPQSDKTSAVPSRSSYYFLSYSRDDIVNARKLYKEIHRWGGLLWMDEVELKLGVAWEDVLQSRVEMARGLIACISPSFLQSKNCLQEIEWAQTAGTPIYPLIVRRLDKPSEEIMQTVGLHRPQYLNLTQNYRRGLYQVIKTVVPLTRRLQAAAIYVFVISIVVGLIAGLTVWIENELLKDDSESPPYIEEDIGVVVSYFQITDSSINHADANRLIDRFSKYLGEELEKTLGARVGVLYPNQVELVSDNESADASKWVERYNADLVVYGSISRNPDTNEIQLDPKYYVDPEKFVDALEMTGSFTFGSPIRIKTSLDAAFDSEAILQARTTALAHVLVGLSQFLLGDDDDALLSFAAADKAILDSPPAQSPSDGREVIHVLTGNTQLRSAQTAVISCDRDAVLQSTLGAENEFLLASELVTDYARAYVGLAIVNTNYALWEPAENANCEPPPRLDIGYLEVAQSYIEYAETLTNQPTELAVQTRLQAIKAHIFFLTWAAEDPTRTPETTEQLRSTFSNASERILQAYENGDEPLLSRLVIQVYTDRGGMAQIDGDNRSAIKEFDLALAVPDIPAENQMYLNGYKGDCYFELGQYPEAAQSYGVALNLAEQLGSNLIPYYENRQREADRLAQSSGSS